MPNTPLDYEVLTEPRRQEQEYRNLRLKFLESVRPFVYPQEYHFHGWELGKFLFKISVNPMKKTELISSPL